MCGEIRMMERGIVMELVGGGSSREGGVKERKEVVPWFFLWPPYAYLRSSRAHWGCQRSLRANWSRRSTGGVCWRTGLA